MNSNQAGNTTIFRSVLNMVGTTNTWTQVLWELIQAHWEPGQVFRRKELIHGVLPQVVERVGCLGVTPAQTMSRELQILRDSSLIEFIQGHPGEYRYHRRILLRPIGCNWQGEALIARILDSWCISYEREKRFPDLRCCYQGVLSGHLRFDFYLGAHNVVIEFDGAQHDRPVDYFGGQAALEKRQAYDRRKNRWCYAHGARIIRIRVLKHEVVRGDLRDFLRDGSVQLSDSVTLLGW